ncbi:MAG: CBS domain-containing protein [Candidatus Altiarchaeota archaeon]
MDFVRDVMVSRLLTIHGSATVSEAAKLMAHHDIGSLVVVPDGMPHGRRLHVSETGLLTERDIMVRVVARDKPTNMSVLDACTRSPHFIDAGSYIADAFDYIERHGMRWLLVSSGDEVVGIVTLKDLNKAVRCSCARRLMGVHEREHFRHG